MPTDGNSSNLERGGTSETGLHGSGGASFAQKGWRILAGMLLYLLLATGLIGSERMMLFESMSELEAIHDREEQQLALNYLVAHAILTVNENYLTEDLSSAGRLLTLEVDGMLSQLLRIEMKFGGDLSGNISRLGRINRDLLSLPTRSSIAGLREELHQLVLKLDGLTLEIRNRKAEILNTYRSVFNRLTLELFALMFISVAIVGGISSIFFRQLSRDIGLIKIRAGEIVRGYRGSPLPVTRDDELGVLMSAINEMEAELKSRENQLELSRQQHFHTEKMAAVGSLAAAVAHEINNPLAAIVGFAESLANELRLRGAGELTDRGADHQISLILEQARRVMAITRQIGEFALQRPLVPSFVDLNALIRSTCTFISFDKRFRGVTLQQTLAMDLPAVFVVSDHIVQVLMNLLINAADALEDKQEKMPMIIVTSKLEGAFVILDVADNGPGIASENIDRVFDTHFTTKLPGRGSGLGLSLCRSLVERDGGTIAVDSVFGQGTTVVIKLPIPAEV